MEDRLAGDVRDVVSAGRGGASERPLAEPPLLISVEGHAEVLEVEDLLGRLAGHDLDRVLVAEVVGALDGVEGVRLPGVLGVERGVDAAGGGDRVRADRVDLAHDRDGRARVRGGERGSLAGQTGTDDQDVMRGHRSGRYTGRGRPRPAVRGAASRGWAPWRSAPGGPGRT